VRPQGLASPLSEECPEGTTGTLPNCEPVAPAEEEPQSPPAEDSEDLDNGDSNNEEASDGQN
jgi:hypothetical protein